MVLVRLGAVLALALALATPAPAPAPAPTIVVVVHADVPARALSRAEVRRLFLLRRRFWRDGLAVAPVNLPAGSALREAFSQRVLGAATRDLAGYWNDLYFHGTTPPPVLESEEAVALWVSRTSGAIGYVSDATPLPDGARAVATFGP